MHVLVSRPVRRAARLCRPRTALGPARPPTPLQLPVAPHLCVPASYGASLGLELLLRIFLKVSLTT